MFSTCIMHEKCALPFPGIAVPQKFWRVGVGSKQQRNTKKAKKIFYNLFWNKFIWDLSADILNKQWHRLGLNLLRNNFIALFAGHAIK